MMGERQVDQAKLFYEFSLERHVPQDHLLRAVDRFVDLERSALKLRHSHRGGSSWRILVV